MKILFVCDRLDTRGGLEKMVTLQANHLRTLGHEVRFLTRYVQQSAPAFALADGIAVDSAGCRHWPALWRRVPGMGRFAKALRACVRQWHPDVLILNGADLAGLALAVLPRAVAARSICCDHNHLGAVGPHWRWLRARTYGRAAAVVSLTDQDLPAYLDLNPRAVRIYNGSDVVAGAPWQASHRMVLAVGRMTPQKGFDLLLDAWGRLGAAAQGWTLQVVGEGADHAALEHQRQALPNPDSVQFAPATPHVSDYYGRAGVFVLSSRYEGFPVVLVEAQLAGLPCVAFDCPTGPREVLGADSPGLVPAGDPAQLAQTLAAVLTDTALREQLADAARATAHRFAPQTFLGQWAALVAQVGASAAAARRRH